MARTSFVFICVCAFMQPALAQANAAEHQSPTVVEFFTSQSCSSCVPANEQFSALASRSDIVALNWHVDYWNTLFTQQGRWVDPYSSAEYTQRQRTYNENIRQRRSVYTPQIVIGGDTEIQGNAGSALIEKVDQSSTSRPASKITTRIVSEKIEFSIVKNSGGNAYLIYFDLETQTAIQNGENAGKTMSERNVVTKVERLGVVRRSGATFETALTPKGKGCALLIQEPRQGRIIDATYCPSA